jgi:hypothetical protein
METTPPTQTEQQPPKKGGALGVVALIFSALFFVPFAPILGLILGIVALVTAPPNKKTVPIVAVCIAPVTLFLLQGMMAAIAIPAFLKYIRRSKTMEARMTVRSVADAVAMRAGEGGSLPTETDWAPPGRACDHPNGKFPPSASEAFRADPWRALGVEPQVSYYQLRLRRDGNGVAVEARGDLDCDGDYSLFSLTVGADGRLGPLHTERDIE